MQHTQRYAQRSALRQRRGARFARATLLFGQSRLLRRRSAAHSGMFPCFFGGSVSRLVRRARSARVTFIRVFDGEMTVSM